MPKPAQKKPRLVEVTDLAEQTAVRLGMEGEVNKPIGFCWGGTWWAESDSLRKWREKKAPEPLCTCPAQHCSVHGERIGPIVFDDGTRRI